MKFPAFLFSFYLLFLAIEPGVEAMFAIEGQFTACCSDATCGPIENEAPGSHSESDETTNACNPFQFCKCCSFVNRDINMVAYLPLQLFSSAHIDYKENVPPQISLDVWQPPKLA